MDSFITDSYVTNKFVATDGRTTAASLCTGCLELNYTAMDALKSTNKFKMRYVVSSYTSIIQVSLYTNYCCSFRYVVSASYSGQPPTAPGQVVTRVKVTYPECTY
ncbi:hypothetical protein EON64_07900 [archaeon]|nr:MAG: hypothetical protein EON64_07900 [archaeon]